MHLSSCYTCTANLTHLLTSCVCFACVRALFLNTACAPCAAARVMMWVLQDVPEMNALGVERMIRGLALLQVGVVVSRDGRHAPPPYSID